MHPETDAGQGIKVESLKQTSERDTATSRRKRPNKTLPPSTVACCRDAVALEPGLIDTTIGLLSLLRTGRGLEHRQSQPEDDWPLPKYS